MRKGLMLALLGGAAFIIFLVLTAPASLLAHAIRSALPVELEGVSGTLWHGAIQRVSAPENLQLGPLSWRLHGWRLLRGEISLSLEIPADAPNLSGKADAAVTILKTLYLSNVDLQADANWVFTQAALPIAAAGNFNLRIESAELRRGQLPLLHGQLEWQNARVVYPQQHALGAYRLIMHPQPETDPEYLLGEISDINSPFKINGTVKIEHSGAYQFSARLATAPDAPQIFRDTLLFLGEPAADGSVSLERSGNIFEEYGS
ncbi:MAG TPA: type II secretion system protein N [Gammaproteobacteria bacterium]|nr:type II secretion system protein N [Gammaproteobacteria bacterium]